MSCRYCRGEKPLCDEMDDGGWQAFIHPASATMTAHFDAGCMYDNACGLLELDIEYCPMCGTPMIYVMEEALNG